jgi:hypothetical protein
MALYQPVVVLSWKYLKSAVSPDPNLKIVWSVDVQLAAGELLTYSVTQQQTNYNVVLTIGGNNPGRFTKEWNAPFNVSYGLVQNAANEAIIRGQIHAYGPITVNTKVIKNGLEVGDVANYSSSNSGLIWN